MSLSLEESKPLFEKLRAVIKEIAAGDVTRIDALIDVGGELFDSNFLDGHQYSMIYDLRQSPTNAELINRCLTGI